MDESTFLADIIFLFHMAIVLFVLLAPFTQISAILILHITFCLSLLVHWYANSNVCSLTLLEGHFRGLNHTNTFTHQLISPMYDISDTDASTIAYIITYIVMFISIYYLYNSQEFKNALEEYNNSSGGLYNLFSSFGKLLIIKNKSNE
jgi:hypothetical protein